MIDWSSIDTVILDMDGTVLDLHFDNRFWMHHLPEAYARHHKLTREEGSARLLTHFVAHQGTLNWYCTDFWSDIVGFDVASLKLDLRHLIRERADAFAFLAQVKASGRKVWLATNAHRDSLDIKLAELGFGHFFDVMVSAHDFGAAKESQDFWHGLQTAHPFTPATALFIDDSEPVLESAERFGIAHLVSILTPDSHKPTRSGLRFPAIDHFHELGLPNLRQPQTAGLAHEHG